MNVCATKAFMGRGIGIRGLSEKSNDNALVGFFARRVASSTLSIRVCSTTTRGWHKPARVRGILVGAGANRLAPTKFFAAPGVGHSSCPESVYRLVGIFRQTVEVFSRLVASLCRPVEDLCRLVETFCQPIATLNQTVGALNQPVKPFCQPVGSFYQLVAGFYQLVARFCQTPERFRGSPEAFRDVPEWFRGISEY